MEAPQASSSRRLAHQLASIFKRPGSGRRLIGKLFHRKHSKVNSIISTPEVEKSVNKATENVTKRASTNHPPPIDLPTFISMYNQSRIPIAEINGITTPSANKQFGTATQVAGQVGRPETASPLTVAADSNPDTPRSIPFSIDYTRRLSTAATSIDGCSDDSSPSSPNKLVAFGMKMQQPEDNEMAIENLKAHLKNGLMDSTTSGTLPQDTTEVIEDAIPVTLPASSAFMGTQHLDEALSVGENSASSSNTQEVATAKDDSLEQGETSQIGSPVESNGYKIQPSSLGVNPESSNAEDFEREVQITNVTETQIKSWPLSSDLEHDWNSIILPQLRKALYAKQSGRLNCKGDKDGDTIQLVAHGPSLAEATFSIFVISSKPAMIKNALLECRVQDRIPGVVFRFQRKPRKIWRSHDPTALQNSLATSTNSLTLTSGVALYGFRDEQFIGKVTVGGFINLASLPFALTAGHLFSVHEFEESERDDLRDSDHEETDAIIPKGDPSTEKISPWFEMCDWEEWSPSSKSQAELEGIGSEMSSAPEDFPEGETTTKWLGFIKASSFVCRAPERIDFRISRDLKSPIVGISKLESGKGETGNEMKLSDDWSLVIPANGVQISQYQPIIGVRTETELPNLDVSFLGLPSDRRAYGRIGAAPSLIRLPGNIGFSRAWSIELNQPSVRGISGAWIRDERNHLVGQVVASVDGTPLSYFIPAAQVLGRIQRHFPGFPIEVPREIQSEHIDTTILQSIYKDIASYSGPLTHSTLRRCLTAASRRVPLGAASRRFPIQHDIRPPSAQSDYSVREQSTYPYHEQNNPYRIIPPLPRRFAPPPMLTPNPSPPVSPSPPRHPSIG